MFKMVYTNILPCKHDDTCACPVRVTGNLGTVMEGFDVLLEGSKHVQCAKLASELQSRYKIQDGHIVYSAEKDWRHFLLNRLHESPNMEKVPAPMRSRADFMETPAYDIPEAIKEAYKASDRECLPKYFKNIDFERLHSADEDVGRYLNEVRYRSAYWMTFGTIKGRPFRKPALENAVGQKHIDAVLGYSRKTKNLSPTAREAIKHVDEAMRRLYNAMGYGPDDLGKERSVLDFREQISSFLGSAGGLRHDEVRKVKTPTGENIIIHCNAKKIDVIKDDYDKILEYLEEGIEPDTYWTMVGKVENKFSWDKQDDDLTWEAWLSKMRLFNIPTSFFVKMEQLVSKVRMLKERGKVIFIGCKWPHGGVDILAEALGINSSNHFSPCLAEGDLKNMDQTVHSYFIKLYMEMMLVHEDPKSVDYDAKVKLLEYIIPRMLRRLTRLYSDVWVQHYGTVPSGCFNTSHMDSWIMGLYFFLFLTLQLVNAPDGDKVDLEKLIENAKIVLYGDDHLYNKGITRVSHYLSAYNFQTFLKQTFDMDLKDIYDGIPFLSVVDRGRVVKRGASFLKQFFVLNPHKHVSPDQPMYLPFRETREVMIRAAFGRESSTRTIREVILALLGHAYGTYASNRLTYDLLLSAYQHLMRDYARDWRNDPDLERVYASKSMRKMRAAGITLEQLRQGFPTWDTLISMNNKKKGYHDIREEDFIAHYDECFGSEW